MGLEALSPVQVVLWRLLLGLVALLVISGLKRSALPRSARTWGHLMVLAVLLNATPFTLFGRVNLIWPHRDGLIWPHPVRGHWAPAART